MVGFPCFSKRSLLIIVWYFHSMPLYGAQLSPFSAALRPLPPAQCRAISSLRRQMVRYTYTASLYVLVQATRVDRRAVQVAGLCLKRGERVARLHRSV